MIFVSDIYLVRTKWCAPLEIQYYDVTYYESSLGGNRQEKSPTSLACYLNRADIVKADAKEIFTCSPLNKWMKLRMDTSIPWIILWFLYRTTYVLLNGLLVLSINHEIDSKDLICNAWPLNITLPSTHLLTVAAVVMAISLIGILIDVLECCALCRHKSLQQVKLQSEAVQTDQNILTWKFYRLMQLVQNISMLIVSMSYIADYVGGQHLPGFGIIWIVLPIFGSVWSTFYFLQMIPSLGHYVVALQFMLFDFIRFCVLFSMLFISYVLAIQILVSQNAVGVCPPQFKDLIESAYSAFLTMLNMIDYQSISFRNPQIVYAFHSLFVLSMAVLVLNFLIGVLSNTYTFMEDHATIITKIQHMSIVMTVDYRVSCILNRIQQCFKRRHYIIEDKRILFTYVHHIRPGDDK